MSGNLKMGIKEDGNSALIELEGAINEDIVFDDLKGLNVDKLIFDFDKVTIINSCGIREWINFLGTQESKKIHYINCRQIIVEQVNMIYGFLPDNGTIDSFYAPYYCEDCDIEKKILLKTPQIVSNKAPSIKCDKCSTEMEFDALEDQYFRFIK